MEMDVILDLNGVSKYLPDRLILRLNPGLHPFP